MTKIKLKVTGASAVAKADGKITAGMVGVPVEIEYDESWNGLKKTAVFRADDFGRDRKNIDTETTVPWEVLRTPGKTLYAGVEGRDADDSVVIPTVWAVVDKILDGANATVSGSSDSPSVDSGGSGGSGEDGGYYFPTVDENGFLNWEASKHTMPEATSEKIVPTRGVDYWTEADKEEIKSFVDEAVIETLVDLDLVPVLQDADGAVLRDNDAILLNG